MAGSGAVRIVAGNLLFVVCCISYLAWWLLAFRPTNPVTGMRSDWLFIPAFATGIAGIVFIVWGMSTGPATRRLFPAWWAVVGAIVGFIVILALTWWLFDRPLTSELFLIVGWTALVLAELSALYGTGSLSHPLVWAFIAIVTIVFLICLVCYVLYFKLDPTWSFYDGMVPLILTALVMAAISVAMLVSAPVVAGR